MAERAQVTSLEALEAFRANLLVYLAKARAALEEADDQRLRTRSWLENDQRSHWERECRRLRRELEEAQQELFSAKLSRLRAESAVQVMAVERIKRALHAAEEKREQVRRWNREFGNRVDPLAKQLEQLHTFLTTDLAKAAAYLGNVQRTLETYAAQGLPTAGSAGAGPVAETGTDHPRSQESRGPDQPAGTAESLQEDAPS